MHKTQCDHVVSFYDAFYNEGSIYVALEYMDAGSLADVLSKSKTVPENVLSNIARQVNRLTFITYFEGVEGFTLSTQGVTSYSS